ncbi:MAG TPA: serine protease [Micromonosporaceae bacterium]|jgi:hypothetical protein
MDRHRSVRRRILVGLAGLAIGVAGVLVPGGAAQGGPGGPGDTGGAGGSGLTPLSSATTSGRPLPPGAVRAKGPMPTLGAHGPAFQPLTTTKPRVIGGQEVPQVDVSQYPWIVGLRSYFYLLNDQGVYELWVATCTGTVISPTKVLTAGHCAVDFPFGFVFVVAGRSNLLTLDTEPGGFVARPASVWTHQSFNFTAVVNGEVPKDDVSVLTLSQPLPAAYTPVTLSAQGDQTPYAGGTPADILGYGIYDVATEAYGILHKASVTMQTWTACNNDWGSLYDGNRMICAGVKTPQVVDSCSGDSGGPLLVNGVEVGITDWGSVDCTSRYGVYERLSRYADSINADVVRPAAPNLDWSGDGHTDLIARDSSGRLREYSGSGFLNDGHNGFNGVAIINFGWSGYTKLLRANSWAGKGTTSILARDSAGNLYRYDDDGTGGIKPRVKIGSGWNGFNEIVAVNNWTAPGSVNLLARKPNGDLFRYNGNGAGGFSGGGVKVGAGWNIFDRINSPGSWKGDGKPSLLARKPDGDLFLYTGSGSGGFAGAGVKMGSGWNMFSRIITPGDWNGDNLLDVIGITPTGSMRLYMTNGKGAWIRTNVTINSGWSALNAVF